MPRYSLDLWAGSIPLGSVRLSQHNGRFYPTGFTAQKFKSFLYDFINLSNLPMSSLQHYTMNYQVCNRGSVQSLYDLYISCQSSTVSQKHLEFRSVGGQRRRNCTAEKCSALCNGALLWCQRPSTSTKTWLWSLRLLLGVWEVSQHRFN